MRRIMAWGVAAAVLVAVVATGLTVLRGRPAQPAAGPVAVGPSPPATTPSSGPRALPSAPAPEPKSEIGVSSARLKDLEVTDEPVPVALDIADVGIEAAPIDPVGVEADGAMEIPEDVARVGWYRFGPTPGQPEGSAVLTAHIDSRTQGKGVFYDLDQLSERQIVEISMSDGSVREFAVDEVRQIPKVDLPTGDLFRRDGAPRLALITCGGTFDQASRHYRDNIVVVATPIS